MHKYTALLYDLKTDYPILYGYWDLFSVRFYIFKELKRLESLQNNILRTGMLILLIYLP